MIALAGTAPLRGESAARTPRQGNWDLVGSRVSLVLVALIWLAPFVFMASRSLWIDIRWRFGSCSSMPWT